MWRFGIAFLSALLSPLFSWILCRMSLCRNPNPPGWTFWAALAGALLLFCRDALVLLTGFCLPFWALAGLSFFLSFQIVGAHDPEWNEGISFHTLGERFKSLAHLSPWHGIVHGSVLLYLVAVVLLSLGGFALLPGEALRVGYSDFSKQILMGSLAVLGLGLFFGLFIFVVTGRSTVRPLSVLWLGIPGLLFLCILMALGALAVLAFMPFDLSAMENHFQTLSSGSISFWEKWVLPSVSYRGMLLFFFAQFLVLIVFLGHFQAMGFFRRFFVLGLCCLLDLVAVGVIQYHWVSKVFLNEVLPAIAEGSSEDLRKAEQSLDRLEKLEDSWIQLPFVHYRNRLATSALALGEKALADSLFEGLSAKEEPRLTSPHFLTENAKRMSASLSKAPHAEVVGMEWRLLSPVSYLPPEWQPFLTVLFQNARLEMSEEDFKQKWGLLSKNIREVELPRSILTLSHLRRFARVLGYETLFFKIGNPSALKSFLKKNEPLLLEMNPARMDRDFLMDSAGMDGSLPKWILPVCLSIEANWIGFYEGRYAQDFKKHKDPKELERLLTEEEPEEAPLPSLLSCSQRQQLKILPLDLFWNQFRDSGSVALSFSNKQSPSPPITPFSQWDTFKIQTLREGEFYFQEGRYLEAFQKFQRVFKDPSLPDALHYLGLIALILNQRLGQPEDILLTRTLEHWRTFRDDNKTLLDHAEKRFLSALEQGRASTGLQFYYWKRVQDHSWNLDLEKRKELLRNASLRSPHNREILLLTAWSMMALDDFQGLCEVLPRLLTLSPHLSAYRLILSHALLRGQSTTRAREMFESLPWILETEEFPNISWRDFEKNRVRTPSEDLTPLRWKWNSAKWNYLAGYFARQDKKTVLALFHLEKAVKGDASNVEYLSLYEQTLREHGSKTDLLQAAQVRVRLDLLSGALK